ncbi:hypothetical protein [Streptomyces tremellae]|uniref:Ig-like domain-containing protein n=1 Tax=Streptomyces tremellae TaxID=1124239 RepID=A0ABP7FED6_9ACTN
MPEQEMIEYSVSVPVGSTASVSIAHRAESLVYSCEVDGTRVDLATRRFPVGDPDDDLRGHEADPPQQHAG